MPIYTITRDWWGHVKGSESIDITADSEADAIRIFREGDQGIELGDIEDYDLDLVDEDIFISHTEA